MSNLAARIEPFHADPELNDATHRGFMSMKAPDVLAIFDDAANSVKSEILDFLGGEKISRHDLNDTVEAYLIRSDTATFPALIELFESKAVGGVPVKIDLSGDYRRLRTEGTQIEMRHLVVVGNSHPALP